MSVDESRDYDLDCIDFPMLSSSLPSTTITTGHKHHQIRYSFQKKPFIIGVAGGTASGKSTVCDKIIEKLGPIDPTSVYLSHEKRVVRISQDSFYRKLTDEDREMVKMAAFNFDHPEAFDFELMYRTLRDVCSGKMVRVPIYDYEKNEISDQEETIYPADVVLFEGLLLFYFPELRRLFHMKIFVDTDSDTRLSRRVLKDVKERKRDLSTVLTQYLKFVKPSFEEYCLPTKKHADIVVPRGPENEVAVELIVTQIRSVYDPSTRHQSIKLQSYISDDYQNDEEEYLASKHNRKNNFKDNCEKSKQEKSTSTSSDTGWYDSDVDENFDEKSSSLKNPQGGLLSQSSSVPRSNPIPVGRFSQNDDLMYEFDEKFGPETVPIFQNGFKSPIATIKCGGTKSLAMNHSTANEDESSATITGSPNTRRIVRANHESRPSIFI